MQHTCDSTRRRTMGVAVAVLAAVLAWPGAAPAAPVLFSASAGGAAGIQATVDAFRADLGALNPNVPGSFGAGRREINWDGVPNALAAPNDLPTNFFNLNSPRGAVFGTPGTGFQVSANAGVAPVEFDTIDPSYSLDFGFFSPQRLFTPIGANVMEVLFFVPGTDEAALTRGFGAIFTDVDLPGTTSIQFFGAGGASLGTFFAQPFAGDESFSFLGATFATPTISRVRITTGNAALGAGVLDANGNPTDLVVMDDFIYGEPTLAQVPEPGTLLLVGLGLLGFGARRCRA